jgi:SAM-dependent methyltransferase
LNLPCYPTTVRKLTIVEPNPGMHRRLQRRVKETGIAVDRRTGRAENLPFDDAQFDVVVSTFTLCSIDAVGEAVRQVWRVLKPGGRFVFLEHGLSPEPRIQRSQRRWNWLQGLFGDGCRLDRDFRPVVSAVPFQSVEIRNFELEATPKTHAYMYCGVGQK